MSLEDFENNYVSPGGVLIQIYQVEVVVFLIPAVLEEDLDVPIYVERHRLQNVLVLLQLHLLIRPIETRLGEIFLRAILIVVLKLLKS